MRCGAFVGFDSLYDAAEATIGLVRASLPTLYRCELSAAYRFSEGADGGNADGPRLDPEGRPIGTVSTDGGVVGCQFGIDSPAARCWPPRYVSRKRSRHSGR